LPDHQWHHGERRQQRLQEGQFDLERMLRRVRSIGLHDKIGDGGQRIAVHRHATERRCKGLDRRSGDAAQGNEMRRPHQHHALDRVAAFAQGRKCLRRHGPRIDVARVRCDQRLGQHAGGWFDRAEQFRDRRAQPTRISGIE